MRRIADKGAQCRINQVWPCAAEFVLVMKPDHPRDVDDCPDQGFCGPIAAQFFNPHRPQNIADIFGRGLIHDFGLAQRVFHQALLVFM
ncbi:hypothetical protein BAR1_06625 [Profundibacter amoris]|uniref:Uncharacterized protein n=1 Tax=Profundibacter amoris TaxID=2171755 RepID=A0A347UFK5_9RHOB|nr:hypothetical protein BAR1_06625 [Profundibacter amoris]